LRLELYSVRNPLWARVVGVLFFLFSVWLLGGPSDDGAAPFIAVLAAEGWIGIGKILVIVVSAVHGMGASLLERVLFTEAQIERRNSVGRRSIYRYEELVDISETPRRYLELCFEGGRRFKVYGGASSLARVAQILKEKSGRKAHSS
jgi:hypothetical protein